MTEQFEIVALTDVDVAFVQPMNNEGDVIVRKSITAYKRLDTGVVQKGLFELVAQAGPSRGQMYRFSLPSDSLVRMTVQKGEKGRLWMQNLPEPARDEALQALLEEQIAEKTFTDDSLGLFRYDRETGVYQCDIAWRDKTITLEVEDVASTQPRDIAHKLMAEAEKWELSARAQIKKINPAASRMSMRSVSIDNEGAFTFWFAGKLGIAYVAGSLEDGITDAIVL